MDSVHIRRYYGELKQRKGMKISCPRTKESPNAATKGEHCLSRLMLQLCPLLRFVMSAMLLPVSVAQSPLFHVQTSAGLDPAHSERQMTETELRDEQVDLLSKSLSTKDDETTQISSVISHMQPQSNRQKDQSSRRKITGSDARSDRSSNSPEHEGAEARPGSSRRSSILTAFSEQSCSTFILSSQEELEDEPKTMDLDIPTPQTDSGKMSNAENTLCGKCGEKRGNKQYHQRYKCAANPATEQNIELRRKMAKKYAAKDRKCSDKRKRRRLKVPDNSDSCQIKKDIKKIREGSPLENEHLDHAIPITTEADPSPVCAPDNGTTSIPMTEETSVVVAQPVSTVPTESSGSSDLEMPILVSPLQNQIPLPSLLKTWSPETFTRDWTKLLTLSKIPTQKYERIDKFLSGLVHTSTLAPKIKFLLASVTLDQPHRDLARQMLMYFAGQMDLILHPSETEGDGIVWGMLAHQLQSSTRPDQWKELIEDFALFR